MCTETHRNIGSLDSRNDEQIFLDCNDLVEQSPKGLYGNCWRGELQKKLALIARIVVVPRRTKLMMLFINNFLGLKIPQPQTNPPPQPHKWRPPFSASLSLPPFLLSMSKNLNPYRLTHHLLPLPSTPSLLPFSPLTIGFRSSSVRSFPVGVAVFLSKFHGFDGLGVEKRAEVEFPGIS